MELKNTILYMLNICLNKNKLYIYIYMYTPQKHIVSLSRDSKQQPKKYDLTCWKQHDCSSENQDDYRARFENPGLSLAQFGGVPAVYPSSLDSPSGSFLSKALQ